MATLTEFVAAVVVHSSAAAFSHFGVALDAVQSEKTPIPDERVVARSPRPDKRAARVQQMSGCPAAPAATAIRT
jgi:hypothetical protein